MTPDPTQPAPYDPDDVPTFDHHLAAVEARVASAIQAASRLAAIDPKAAIDVWPIAVYLLDTIEEELAAACDETEAIQSAMHQAMNDPLLERFVNGGAP